MKSIDELIERCRVPAGTRVKLENHDPAWSGDKSLPKDERKRLAQAYLSEDTSALAEAQELLYASDSYAILLIFQAMDAAGKDGTIKHVMSGVNPQGVQVYSFKQPSAEELDHDFLWRCSRALPQRGRIGIFNRSYYEEVLIVRVHPELLVSQRIPGAKSGRSLWEERYDSINHYERHLSRNGAVILKFFLHISRDEQRQRFLDRLEEPQKHWKFAAADLAERAFWDDYMGAYEDAMSATSTEWAPWYIIPADHKWVSRSLVAAVVARTISGLDLHYPEVTPEKLQQIEEARKALEK